MRTEDESKATAPVFLAATGIALCTLVILTVFLGVSLVADAGPKQPQADLVVWMLALLSGVWCGSVVYFHLILRRTVGQQSDEGRQTQEQRSRRRSGSRASAAIVYGGESGRI